MTGKALLWLNDAELPLADTVKAAAQRFRHRVGESATLCYVHPTMVAEPITVGGLRVEPRASIPPHHLLVGRAA